jgi:hypothetical protein
MIPFTVHVRDLLEDHILSWCFLSICDCNTRIIESQQIERVAAYGKDT